MRPSKSLLGTLFISSAMGLTLAACNRNPAQQPLSTAELALPATAAVASPGPLEDRYGPPPKKIPVGRVVDTRNDWAWADRSYALDSVFYDTPPDYGFYYDDYEPWVWQTSDRWAMYGDPYDYGYPYDEDYYYYYYQPGAVRPYFIRDAAYGYGFDDYGRLVVIYDLLGRIMPQSFLYEREPYVSRYYQRAYLVRQASLRARPVVITQQVWQERAPVVRRFQQRWIQAAQTQPQWVDYRQRTGDRFVRAFADDRRRREQRIVAANAGAPQNRGFLASTFGGRDQPAQLAQAPRNHRGFLGLGGRDRERQRQAAPQPSSRQQAQVDQSRRGLAGLFGGGDRRREAQALKSRPQSAEADRNRRGFLNGRDHRPEPRQQAPLDQARGRDRQARAGQQQAQQRQLQGREAAAARVRQDNAARQREQMVRQQQVQARQAKVQAREGQDRQRQAQQARQQQAQARRAEAQPRPAADRERQEPARQKQASMREQQVQARQQQALQARQQQAQQAREKQVQARQQQAQARQQQALQARQQQAQQARQKQAHDRQLQAEARQQQAQARQKQAQQKRNQEANAEQNSRNRGRGHNGCGLASTWGVGPARLRRPLGLPTRGPNLMSAAALRVC
jgi:hypothetical protein